MNEAYELTTPYLGYDILCKWHADIPEFQVFVKDVKDRYIDEAYIPDLTCEGRAPAIVPSSTHITTPMPLTEYPYYERANLFKGWFDQDGIFTFTPGTDLTPHMEGLRELMPLLREEAGKYIVALGNKLLEEELGVTNASQG